ncbi:glycosyltransferase [Parasediminibacterium sp. JCM 36343]|uniref:glycosyltransferase n=1 Tax=Parasediminibacterium sp. JCM 36343 TaxID=3374279 RepID=UPI003979C676
MNKFSIILPVRNGGEYIKECVGSILNQELQDFNLIVLDNNSTDGTVEWVTSLKDKRIVIYSSTQSLSIEENWTRALTVPKNEFITLIGHDDILFPGYLTTMDALIARHPTASLYQTHFTYIDSVGKLIKACKPMDEVQQPHEFLGHFLCNQIDTMGTGFMMRAKDYEKVGGIPPRYPNLLFADFELWVQLTKIHYKATAFETCFSFRLHQSTTTTSADDKFQKAFGIFIHFLAALKKESPLFANTIERYVLNYINIYCQGLTHRLLRTPKKMRNQLTVSLFLENCKGYVALLLPNVVYEPSSNFSVRLATYIDSNLVTRSIFLLFKRMYKKPIY